MNTARQLTVVKNDDPLAKFRKKIKNEVAAFEAQEKSETTDFSEAMSGGAEAKQRELTQLQLELTEFDQEYQKCRDALVARIKERENIIQVVKKASAELAKLSAVETWPT